MLLKVGDLAKQAGLTVRTLHHYDAIGLLTPSARSASGYRLYNRDDVARLHAIQALRQIGLPLAKIGEALATESMSLSSIVAQQIRTLDQEIEQARELRSRLSLVEAAINSGAPPKMEEWLKTIDLMSTYRKHFTHAELQKILGNWKKTEEGWIALSGAVQDAMDRKLRPDSVEVQRLAQRWMNLSMHWMQGDLDLVRRWGEMMVNESATDEKVGIDPAMIRYIDEAIGLRMAAFLRHITPDQLQRLDKRLDKEWGELTKRAARLMQANIDLAGDEAQTLAADWDALTDRMVGHDPDFRRRFVHAYRVEPLLRIGHFVTPEMRDFIDRIHAAKRQPPVSGAEVAAQFHLPVAPPTL